MYFDLSKSQKKIARRVMDKGIDEHYRRALADAEKIITRWRKGEYSGNKDAYMSLFKKINQNDNNISRTYDGKGGSRWVEIMSMQLAQGVISREDLIDFDEEVRDAIVFMSGIER